MYDFKNQHIKAVVLIPPIEDFYATPHRHSSLGATIVVKLLEQASVETLLIDGLHPDAGKRQIPLPNTLSYLTPHILPDELGKCSFFRHYYHFGNTLLDLTTKVAQFNPQLCFIACFAYCYNTTALELSKIIRSSIPELTIIVGGAGVTVYPDFFLQNSSIDYTLSGEAEIALPPFIDFIKRGGISPEQVPFLGWKSGNRSCYSPGNRYTKASTLRVVIKKTATYKQCTTFTTSLSRGCSYRCNFCANHLTHGNDFRHCSIDQFREVLDLLEPQPCNSTIHFNFEDDNLLCDIPFFYSIIAMCTSRFSSVHFTAENGLDYRLLTPEICTKLIHYGFRQFNFTIGSVLPEILERTGRCVGLEHYDELLRCSSHYAIPVVSYFICGLPNDTKQSIAATLRFLLPRSTTIGISLFYAVPGLLGFKDFSLFDALPSQLCCGSSAYPWNSLLSTETLITAFRLSRLINLMKNPTKTEEDKELIQKTLQTRSLHTILKERGHRKIISIPFQDEELVKMVLQ